MNSKTRAQIIGYVDQSELKEGDIGYIDGYVQAADSRPYAVFVRESDGTIEMVNLFCLKALEVVV